MLYGISFHTTPTVGFGFIYDEWGNILEEQERRLKSFPAFWGHLEIKADALYHLKRISEAKAIYQEALKNITKDQDLSEQKKFKILN